MALTRPIILSAMAWLLLFSIYQNGLQGPFLFDDFPNIVDNPAVHLNKLTAETLLNSLDSPDAGPLGRPVSVLSFALTHYFFGLDPFAFKAVNLAIHALNGLLAGWLMALFLARACGQTLSPTALKWLPLWASAAWLLHPINTIPILLSVQRMTELSALFIILALIGHLKFLSATTRPRRLAWFAFGWLLAWPLAIFSKETGILFPLFAILVTLLHPRDVATPAPRGKTIALAVGLLAAATGAIFAYLGLDWLNHGYAMRTFTMTERLLTEARVLWFYAGQILVPVHSAFGLYLDDIPVSSSLMQPTTTLPAVAGWALVAATLPFAWRRWPIPAFGITWFLIGHSLESTFLPLEIAHEYRNYLPSLGLILGAGWVGARGLAKVRLDHPKVTAALAALLPIVVLSGYTAMRAQQWSDPLTGSQVEAIHHAESWRANYTAGQLLFKHGHGDAGDPIGGRMIQYHFQKAARLGPSEKLPLIGLISWACASRRPLTDNWPGELAHRLAHTPYSPQDRTLPSALLNIVVPMPDCLDRKTGLALFTAGSQNPNIAPSLRAAFLDAAADYELLGAKDPVSAQALLAKAVALAPGDPALQRKLAGFTAPRITQE